MSYLSLIWTQLWRNPMRTTLTGLSLIVAFLLFGLLQPINQILGQGPTQASIGRLIVIPKHSTSDLLPIAHFDRIQQIDGVADTSHVTWFGGTYVDPANFFAQYAVTPADYLNVMPELKMPKEQRTAFLSNRLGAIVGFKTAEKFNWQIGDRIPIIPNIWHNRDNQPWEFELVGIFTSEDTSIVDNTGFYFNYAYFDEYRAFANGTVGSYVVRIADSNQTNEVANKIDALFANSSAETKTLSDREYALSFARQMGNVSIIVSSILGAVLFTILLLTGNTITQSNRERIPELAVMKVLGFQTSALFAVVLLESILLTVFAAIVGLLGAHFLLAKIATGLPQLAQIGITGVPMTVAAYGLIVAAFIGLLVGFPAALKTTHISVVQALRA